MEKRSMNNLRAEWNESISFLPLVLKDLFRFRCSEGDCEEVQLGKRGKQVGA